MAAPGETLANGYNRPAAVTGPIAGRRKLDAHERLNNRKGWAALTCYEAGETVGFWMMATRYHVPRTARSKELGNGRLRQVVPFKTNGTYFGSQSPPVSD